MKSRYLIYRGIAPPLMPLKLPERNPRQTLALILLISGAAGLSGCHRTGPAQGEDAAQTEDAKPVVAVKVEKALLGPIGAEVAASGTVVPEPGREAVVNAATSGKISTITVRQGQRAAKGQTLIQLDSTRLQQLVRQAQAAVASARAQVGQAALEVLAEDQSYRNTVQSAEAALRSAELNLSKLKAGARPQEVAQAEGAVSQAEATLANARATRDRLNTLLQHGIVAKKDAQEAETQYQIAQSQLKNAREALSLVRAGARPQEVADAEVQARQAQNALAAAKAGRVNTRAKEAAMASLRDQEKGAEAALAAAHADLSLATVESPISGVVTQLSVGPGASVDPSTPLLTVADLSQVEFLAQLQPQDLPRVHPGQTVTLTTPAYPNRTWSGTVIQVGQVADPKTNTLPARIGFENRNLRLKDDMYGTVRIHSGLRQAVLVSSIAVLSDESGAYVMVPDPKGVAHRRGVKTGLTANGRTEIVSGLAAGEPVVTSGNYSLEDGTKVTVGP